MCMAMQIDFHSVDTFINFLFLIKINLSVDIEAFLFSSMHSNLIHLLLLY
jgi:hypothetical protein